MGDLMKQLKSIVIFTIIIFLLILPITAFAADIDTNLDNYNPDNLTISSGSVLLMDASTGNINKKIIIVYITIDLSCFIRSPISV